MKIVKVEGNNSPVRLREKPNGAILVQVPQGTIVEVLQVSDNWSQIKIPSGQIGWMMSKYLVDKSSTNNLGELKAKLKEVLALLDKLED